jgi:hypothetical protein
MIFLGMSGMSLGQTNPTAQSLPYAQNFGTSTFTAMPTGMAAWTSGGNRTTQAAAEGAAPAADATVSGAMSSQTGGNVYGYAVSSNARAYIQQSGNATNGTNTIAVAINTGAGITSINVSYLLELINGGSTTQDFGHALQYRVGTSGSWTTVSGSAFTFGAVTTYSPETKSYIISGLTPSTNYQIRWITWRPSGSGSAKGIGVDNINITAIPPAISSTATGGDWSSPSSWVGGVVPTSADNAVIVSGAVITMDNTSYNTRNAGVTTTVDAGGTLATNVTYINNGTTTINGSFQLNGGGWVSDAGGTNPFVYGSNGTLIFNAPYTANNGNYWPTSNGPFNVTVNSGSALNLGFDRTVGGTFQTASGITLSGATLTLNGTCQINAGGFFNNSPIYGNNSLLRYNTGSTYGRGLEWTVGSGTIGTTPGYPNDVQASNNTVINVPNTGNGGLDPFSTAMGMARDLTIDAGSALYMDFGGNNNKSGSLTIGRNLNIDGSVSLGNAIGGDMNIAGNWTNTGTFSPNSRLVSFNGGSAQTLTGPTTFDYLTINNAAGLTLQPLSEVTVNQTLAFTNGKITLGANNVTVGSGGTITGFDATKYIVTNSTGQLRRTVGAASSIFPVGNIAYNPITFNNSGTSDIYGVRLEDGVLTTGVFNTKTVSRRWITSESVAGGSNLSIVGQYNNGEPNSGFAGATDPFIGFYNGTSWSQVAATAAGSDPFTFSSNSNLSPSDLSAGTGYFALGKDNAFISVASNLVITAISPSSPTVGSGFSVTVRSQDAYGEFVNVAAGTSFTLSTNGNAGVIGGTVTGTIALSTSTITVTGVTLASEGTGVTLTATRNSGDVLAAGTSAPFTVLEAATQLALVGVPATGNVGVNLSAFTVEARRPDNSVDNTYTGNITIAKATGAGTLSGTLTVAAVAGVATFSNLQLDAAGTYTLSATSGALTLATSGNIVVTLVPVSLGNYPFTGTASSSGPAARLLPSGVASNVSFSSVSRNNLTINASSGADNNVLSVQPSTGNFGTAVNTSMYVEFTVTPSSGYNLNLGSISLASQRTGAGATNFAIRSSSDAFASNIGTGTTGTSYSTSTVSLSGTSNSAITYRIYPFGGSGTGFWRIDDVTFNGNVLCLDPTTFTVTGGGTRCSDGAGIAVGLSGSQLGMNYQLKRDGSNEGSPLAGTDSALDFPLQTLAGIYTVEASNTNGSCNVNAPMTGSATVTILPNYTITASAGANGTVTPSGNTEVCSGNNQSYTITPAPCYRIATLTVDGSPASLTTGTLAAGGTYEFTNVTAPHTIDATFVLNTYTLTYTAGVGGTITGTSPQSVGCGANGTAITAVPNVGYIFVDWSDATTSNPRTDLNVTADISVTANFEVNCIPPTVLTYSTNPATYCINNLITDNTPSFTGDAAISYAIVPALSMGLNFNTTTGIISGTPTESATAIDYEVTVTNACGNTTADVNIAISPSVTAGTLSGIQDVLVGSTTTFSSTVSGGTWSSDDINIALVNATTGEITGTGLGTTTITYTVTGCNGPATETRSVTVTCAPGSYFDEMSNTCVICPAGSYCPGNTNMPIPCAAGYFSAVTGQSVCTACSAGSSQGLPGQTTCIACAPGSFSATIAATSCQSCAAGTAQPLSGATECTSCPAGTFSDMTGAIECTSCPVNTYNGVTGQTACISCPMGEYSPEGSSVCTSCPAGSYYNIMTASCTTCPAGSYCPEGATAPIACPAGYFSAGTGQSVCTACAAGSSQGLTGQTTCVACAPGTFSATVAATSCQSCAAGTAQPLSGATECTSCPAGTFSDMTGATECTSCPVNTYNGVTGQTACISCPMGEYSPEGSSTCTSCPAGSYYNIMTASCTTCPAGSYCPEGATAPIACPAGYFSAGTGQSVCTACAAGSSQGLTGQTTCVACAPGTFSATVAATSCQSCAAGTAQPLSGATECTSCPAGTFSDMTGAIECTSCPLGQNSMAGSSSCSPCTDYAPLAALYDAMDGANWTDKTGWKMDCDVCSWFGITCDMSGRVTEINLPLNNMNGIIPDLSGLTALKVLDLSNNTSTSSIPVSLASLSNLEGLYLAEMGLTGSIPTQLGNLSNLKYLHLSDNALTGSIPSSLGSLSLLEELLLNVNQLTGAIPGSLGSLNNLTTILLTANNLSGCYDPALSGLCGTTSIDFNENPGLHLEGNFVPFCAMATLGAGGCGLDADVDTYSFPDDCDDTNDALNPNTQWYTDADNDGYPSSATLIVQCARPNGGKLVTELSSTTVDCNDNNNLISPAAMESCDGVDNDCDGTIDEGCNYNCTTIFVTKAVGDYNDNTIWEGDCLPPNPIPVGTLVTILHKVTINNPLENQGTLIVGPSGMLSNMSILTSSGTFTNNGTFTGTGTFIGNFTNTGIFSPGN